MLKDLFKPSKKVHYPLQYNCFISETEEKRADRIKITRTIKPAHLIKNCYIKHPTESKENYQKVSKITKK